MGGPPTVVFFGGREIVAGFITPEDAELMVEPKRSCKTCYGRGTVLWVEGDGYKMETKQIPHLKTGVGDLVEVEEVQVRVENMRRINRACSCTFRHARFKLREAESRARLRIK